MHAARLGQRALAGMVGALAIAGCSTPAGGPDPDSAAGPVIVDSEPSATVQGAQGAGAARPRFFVQWKQDLPGLTRRPTVSAETTPPEYPASAVRNELSGVTTLETCVTVEGKLADIHIVRSSGEPILDTATLDWARGAMFLPAEINGEPFAVCGYRFDHVWQVEE